MPPDAGPWAQTCRGATCPAPRPPTPLCSFVKVGPVLRLSGILHDIYSLKNKVGDLKSPGTQTKLGLSEWLLYRIFPLGGTRECGERTDV